MTNKQILESANEAVTNGDNEGFLKYCTDDAQWTFVGDITLKGKQAIRDYMEKAYLEPPKFEVKQMISEDDYLTAIGNITLIDADGKSTEYTYCDVWKFRDGKMVELTAFVIETAVGNDKL